MTEKFLGRYKEREMLSTKYNKAVVVALFNAGATVLFIILKEYWVHEVSTELQGEIQTSGEQLDAKLNRVPQS